MDSSEIENLLTKARSGDEEALGELLESVRGYLHTLARQQLEPRLQARVGYSDVVSETLLEAHQGFDAFRGLSEAQWLAWLKQIQKHNVANALQKHAAQKRVFTKDQSMDDSRGQLGALKNLLAGQLTSPSHRAIKNEAQIHLRSLIKELDTHQRTAIRMRYLESMPLAEICTGMGRSEEAVAGLLKRGLKQLRTQMASNTESN